MGRVLNSFDMHDSVSKRRLEVVTDASAFGRDFVGFGGRPLFLIPSLHDVSPLPNPDRISTLLPRLPGFTALRCLPSLAKLAPHIPSTEHRNEIDPRSNLQVLPIDRHRPASYLSANTRGDAPGQHRSIVAATDGCFRPSRRLCSAEPVANCRLTALPAGQASPGNEDRS